MRANATVHAADRSYTPALGMRFLTPLYDLAIAGFTRERHWRSLLMPGDRILDVGCGTGTLTRALKQATPEATVIGIDPDPDVLSRARVAAREAGVDILYFEGFFDQAFAEARGPFTKVVSSLVLHHVPLAGKSEILRNARSALPGTARSTSSTTASSARSSCAPCSATLYSGSTACRTPIQTPAAFCRPRCGRRALPEWRRHTWFLPRLARSRSTARLR